VVTGEIQKCVKQNKKKNVKHDSMIEEDLADDGPVTHDNGKPGVDDEDVEYNNNATDDEPTMPHELESDLGPYWTLAQSCQAYVLNTITSYSNIEY
jgi:hypothetical protein